VTPTLVEFANLFAAVVMATKDDADEATIRVFFAGLKHCEKEFLAIAAERLAKEEWPPKLGDWLAMTAKVEAERVEAQRAFLRNLASPLCLACSDTGWARDAADRVHRCDCAAIRRLELLGARPWPTLEIGPAPETSDGPLAPADSSALVASLRERGLKPRIRVMRGGGHAALRSRLARLEDAARDVAQPADQADLNHVPAAPRSGGSTLDSNGSQSDDTERA
jgi:hypothetical protein